MSDGRRKLQIDWDVWVGETKVTFSGPDAEREAHEYRRMLERAAEEEAKAMGEAASSSGEGTTLSIPG